MMAIQINDSEYFRNTYSGNFVLKCTQIKIQQIEQRTLPTKYSNLVTLLHVDSHTIL